ncbi:putative uncharacterized protein [Firmicutes bacterium CAG:582]|nr:putative uncharacterized protein [Firmicutes bacterium CAG:582]
MGIDLSISFFIFKLTDIPPIPYNDFGDVMKRECKCTRSKHRTDEEKRDLTRRLKIIAGQINGIQQMISEDRYCDDVLLQVASATNALKSLGSEILKSHMKSCMVEDIKNDNMDVIEDIIDLFGKLK